MALRFRLSHGRRVKQVDLDASTVTVGRSRSCDLVLPFDWVQRRHLIVQTDPPFARLKLLDPAAQGSLGDGRPLSDQWTRIEPGTVVEIAHPSGSVVHIEISDDATANRRPVVAIADKQTSTLGPDPFGVAFVTESALEGGRGWYDAAEESAPQPPPPIDVGGRAAALAESQRRFRKMIAWTSASIAVLVFATAAAMGVRAYQRSEAIRADVATMDAGIATADGLIQSKQYQAAKAELVHARAIAERLPEPANYLARIDQKMACPEIRFGAEGYVPVEGKWLSNDTARKLEIARRRDEPILLQLEKQAAESGKAGRWAEASEKLLEAIRTMDAEPLKPHPWRERFAAAASKADYEVRKAVALAKGLVPYQDEFVTPEVKETREKEALGFEKYKGEWLPKAVAFARSQHDKGLVLHDGKWVTNDEYQRAIGNVLFEGKYLPARQVEEELARRAEAKRRERETQLAAARKREAEMAEKERAAKELYDKQAAAYGISQQAVKRKSEFSVGRVHPEFKPFGDSSITVTEDDGWYTVKASFDIVSPTGSQGQRKYTCTVRPIAGTPGRWELKKLDIDW